MKRGLHPEAASLARAFALTGVGVWLIGGQAVELLGGAAGRGPVRPHDDLDFFVRAGDTARAEAVLRGLGYFSVHGSWASGDMFFRRDDILLDLVPIRDDLDPPRTLGALAGIGWPPDLLAPCRVEVAGVSVSTLTPGMQRAMKAAVAAFYGTELRDKDRADLAALEALTPPA